MVGRWGARRNKGPAASQWEEDGWTVAGRNPEAKIELFEARAAGQRQDYTPPPPAAPIPQHDPLEGNRFVALAADEGGGEQGGQGESAVDPPC